MNIQVDTAYTVAKSLCKKIKPLAKKKKKKKTTTPTHRELLQKREAGGVSTSGP